MSKMTGHYFSQIVITLFFIPYAVSVPNYYPYYDEPEYYNNDETHYYDELHRGSLESLEAPVCADYERFYPPHNRCYRINTQGPCPEHMKFYSSNEGDQVGVCDCNNEDMGPCDSPLIYFPPTDTCYPANTQGPCQPHKWLTWNNQRHPECQPNICLSYVDQFGPDSVAEHSTPSPSPDGPTNQSAPQDVDSQGFGSDPKPDSNSGNIDPENDLLAVEKNAGSKSVEENEISLAHVEFRVRCGSWVSVHGKCWRTNTRAYCGETEVLKWIWSAYDANLRHVFVPVCRALSDVYDHSAEKFATLNHPDECGSDSVNCHPMVAYSQEYENNSAE